MKASSACILLFCAIFSHHIYGMRTKPMTEYINSHAAYSDDEYASDDNSYFKDDYPSNYGKLAPIFDFSLTQTNRKQNRQKNKGYYDSGYYDYLTTEPFKQRLQDAANWVTDCEAVIEIGGGLNPISKYAQNRMVIVVDPEVKAYVQSKNNQKIIHSAHYFQDWNDEYLLTNKTYAVVVMGLGLGKMPQNGWERLYKLIEKSHKTVIEVSTTYRSGKNQLKNIKKNTSKDITQTKVYDFSGLAYKHYFKNCSHVNPKRKMMLFEKQSKQKTNVLPDTKALAYDLTYFMNSVLNG